MKFFKSTRIYTEDGIVDGFIGVKDGKIASIVCGTIDQPFEDFGDQRIIPGVIDTHNHGAAGYSFNEATTKEEVVACLLGEASAGVTGIFPTVNQVEQFPLLADVADSEVAGAKILGIHSEGPWGARVGEKGDPKNTYYKPVDLDYAKRMVKDARGWLKLVAIAPEVPLALDAIRLLGSLGVTTSAYHTNANFAEANIGIDNGISVATHLGNVMTGLHHRDVGTMGACILRDEVTCELICDGLHVSLPMVQLILKIKENDKIMMISDCSELSGAPIGRYRRPNTNMIVSVGADGFLLSDTGRLMGSSKPVIYGIKNMVNIIGLPIYDVCKMSSLNQAVKYGYQDRGSITVGKFADMVVIDDDYNPLFTYSEGRLVYDHNIDKELFNQSYLAEIRLD